MPKLTPSASKSAKKERMHEEMKKFSEGKMHSGSKTGPTVTSRAQAIAIGLNESGQSKKDRGKRRKNRSNNRSSGRR
jgi:hypothetical protein